MTLPRFRKMMAALLLSLGFAWNFSLYAEDGPPLPPGLEEKRPAITGEPALPEGLGLDEDLEEPILPEGLGDEAQSMSIEVEEDIFSLPFELSGFWEARIGIRTQRDPNEREFSIGETRMQLQVEPSWKQASFKLTSDFLYDPIFGEYEIKLEEGSGFIDLREASLLLRPLPFVDLKLGRQILTWGTGDLVFINDLFPKDWNAFFIGRETEYLKAPSDALKSSFFSSWTNLDIVYTPRFDADRFIDGRRISFFNNAFGRRTGRDAVVQTEKRRDWFKDDEIALRLYQNVRGLELALYGYRGFWKSPAGLNPASGQSTFPRLSVYGGSARGFLGRGIGHLELGVYHSEEDRKGDDPFIRNSEIRFLAGYEQEVLQDWTVGLQYYLEQILDYNNFIRNLPAGSPAADENRHVITLRLTRLLMKQNLNLSLFTFYSPSDRDATLRTKIHYRIDDSWSVELGGNIFIGKEEHTFFGQFEKNTNVYAGLRRGF